MKKIVHPAVEATGNHNDSHRYEFEFSFVYIDVLFRGWIFNRKTQRRYLEEVMKAVLVPDRGRYSIELITETPDEREELIGFWINDMLGYVTCEEFREVYAEQQR